MDDIATLRTYQKEVDELAERLAKDEQGMGHTYFLDISDMDRVCSCGAVYGRGKWWKEPCFGTYDERVKQGKGNP